MGRKILAVIVALITALAVIMIVQMLNSLQITPPSADVMKDSARMSEFMANVPVRGYLVVLLGYVLGAFVGGYIETKMQRDNVSTFLPVVIGVILTFAAILNFIMLPGQPIWFIAISLLAFVPVSLIGYRVARADQPVAEFFD